jgi:uncharacterized protein YneF (UPF0154 family)
MSEPLRGRTVIAMDVMLVLIGILLGAVVGTAICVRYVKQEMTARVGFTMDLLRMQIDNLQGAVNAALANWHAELHDHAVTKSRLLEWQQEVRQIENGPDRRL